MKQSPESSPTLSAAEIQAAVALRLEKYRELSFLEQFAMFMGMAQLLELGLKGLLHREFGVAIEDTERWTLGRTAHVLREKGVRGDFCTLLASVVAHRNHIAHELLANEALLRSLLSKSTRPNIRELEKGIYEMEQLVFLHDWCEEHAAWK